LLEVTALLLVDVREGRHASFVGRSHENLIIEDREMEPSEEG
jgi:hypothetical protein